MFQKFRYDLFNTHLHEALHILVTNVDEMMRTHEKGTMGSRNKVGHILFKLIQRQVTLETIADTHMGGLTQVVTLMSLKFQNGYGKTFPNYTKKVTCTYMYKLVAIDNRMMRCSYKAQVMNSYTCI